jgi:hypothetical protein
MQGVAAPRSYGRVRNSTIQRNVDDETTYETSEMKQPKRPGLASSWQRRSSPQSGVVTLFDNTHQPTPSPPVPCRPQPSARPQRSLNCGLRALLAPSPTSSLSTGLLAHSFRALVALASTSTLVSKGPAHPPLSGRDGELGLVLYSCTVAVRGTLYAMPSMVIGGSSNNTQIP